MLADPPQLSKLSCPPVPRARSANPPTRARGRTGSQKRRRTPWPRDGSPRPYAPDAVAMASSRWPRWWRTKDRLLLRLRPPSTRRMTPTRSQAGGLGEWWP